MAVCIHRDTRRTPICYGTPPLICFLRTLPATRENKTNAPRTKKMGRQAARTPVDPIRLRAELNSKHSPHDPAVRMRTVPYPPQAISSVPILFDISDPPSARLKESTALEDQIHKGGHCLRQVLRKPDPYFFGAQGSKAHIASQQPPRGSRPERNSSAGVPPATAPSAR